MAEPGEAPQGVDASIPNAARMYDYYLGGKDNFEADRVAAEKILALVPGLRQSTQENRRFLRRVVRFLAAEAGIDQFLDIGAGLPTQAPVHTVAQEINPSARVVYADYDPVVVAHGNALLTIPERSIMVRADLRQPGELLTHPDVLAHLDFSRPLAVLLIAVLHFIPDDDEPPEAASQATAIYEQASARIRHRSREQILRLFDGYDLVDPGLVPKHEWRPEGGSPGHRTSNVSWGGVARKPGR